MSKFLFFKVFSQFLIVFSTFKTVFRTKLKVSLTAQEYLATNSVPSVDRIELRDIFGGKIGQNDVRVKTFY